MDAIPAGFRVRRNSDGTLSLHLGSLPSPLPVNCSYLEEILRERRIEVNPGQDVTVDAGIVRDALEETLSYLGHESRSLESLKRAVLHYYRIADEAASAKEVA